MNERKETLEAITRMAQRFSQFRADAGFQTESLDAFIRKLNMLVEDPWRAEVEEPRR